MKKLFITFYLITNCIFAQISEINKFSALVYPVATPASSIVQTANGDLILFWADSTKLYYSRSENYGLTWQPVTLLYQDSLATHIVTDLNSLIMHNGRLLLTFKTTQHNLVYSDDNGNSWSLPVVLPTIGGFQRKRYINFSSLTQLADTLVSFIYSSEYTSNDHYIFQLKSNSGIDWPDDVDTILSQPEISTYGNIIALSDTSLILFYINESNIDSDDYTKIIYQRFSDNGGISWSEPTELIYSTGEISRLKAIKDSAGTIWLFYQKEQPTPFENFTQSDILYIKSSDNGVSWSNPEPFTAYKGFDGWHNVDLINGKPLVSFSTTRNTGLLNGNKTYNIYFGIPGESNDINTPPVIYKKEFVYRNNFTEIEMKIRAYADDDNEIESVFFNYQFSGNDTTQLILYDDGLHNDMESGDGIYGNIITGLPKGYSMNYYFKLIDNLGNISVTNISNVEDPFDDGASVYAMDINNIWLPLNYNGRLSDVTVTDSTGLKSSLGVFEESSFIFSGGFALSGYTNGTLWANGVMSSSRIEDYLAGKVNGDPGDILNRVYFLKSNFPPFSETWQMWKDAVKLGAKFYDGDGDGVYNPVDKNGNGQWDPEEDRPDIIGDQTAWCVYNDKVSPELRRYENVSPLGIEIKQTVFAYSPETHPELSNVIFIRYVIENTGTVADKLDSVYFGAWADADLGNYVDDLVGCDTTVYSGYCYNDNGDDAYGGNPPAFFTTLLQGPATYIPGVTFIDNNGNNIFDEGIDTPVDTAKVFNGKIFTEEYLPGARNQNVSSFIHYMSAHPTQGDPRTETELRCYMEGKTPRCDLINPCDWVYGNVLNMDCEDVNTKFMYSGDPVTQNGWINNFPTDQRQLLNTGPFTLVKNRPVEIIVAYTVGRGTDAVNSIDAAREIVKNAIGFYSTNFTYIPVGIKGTKPESIPTKFVLEQNYPNPFNPSTTIKYTIPGSNMSHTVPVQVKLKVYDILGREVATLVNEKQNPGSYQIKFDAVAPTGGLSSGMYFYRLTAGKFSQTKKMILLK